ncbi:hypothetical protein [Salinarimonas sp.]|uniref:hypothetical protein n=1 Tax=Salinarimonas sp. TaxID=2766526 RepID=UPI0032D90478
MDLETHDRLPSDTDRALARLDDCRRKALGLALRASTGALERSDGTNAVESLRALTDETNAAFASLAESLRRLDEQAASLRAVEMRALRLSQAGNTRIRWGDASTESRDPIRDRGAR